MATTYKLDTVKRGDKGTSVLLLQEILKARNLYKGGLDMKFGPATEKGVIDYQTARIKAGAKLGKADGIVGPKDLGGPSWTCESLSAATLRRKMVPLLASSS